jgi:hypothetical protein
LEIFNSSNSSIRISDNLGNFTGYFNDTVSHGIPGSFPEIVLNGSKTPPYGYSLPKDYTYSINLNKFKSDTVGVYFFTDLHSFSYERSNAVQTQTDQLYFDGGVAVANPDPQTKTVKLLNIINETTQEKVFILRSIGLAQNDSVKIENPDSNKLKFISNGSAKSYSVELNLAAATGLGRFVDSNIPLSANTSHTFVPNWADVTNTDLMVLVDVGNDGTIDDTLYLQNQATGVGDDHGSLLTPKSYNLAQNYPNPFNPVTTIRYQLPVNSQVTLKVFDVLGREVATLVDAVETLGYKSVNFYASGLSSGVYYYRLSAGVYVETKKLLLMK